MRKIFLFLIIAVTIFCEIGNAQNVPNYTLNTDNNSSIIAAAGINARWARSQQRFTSAQDASETKTNSQEDVAEFTTNTKSGTQFAARTTSCGDAGPVEVSNITTTTADIDWNAVGGGAAYEYAITTSIVPPASGTSTGSHSINGAGPLSPATTYYVHVRSDCGSGDFGNWFTSDPFTTLCNAVTTFPFTETFETSSPTHLCWIKSEYESGTLDWSYGAGPGNSDGTTSTAHGGVLNARFFEGDYGATNSTKLVSPKLDLTALSGSGARVRFWYVNEDWGGDQDQLRVYYKTSSGGSWTLIPGAVFTTDQASWTEITLTLPSVSDDYYIAFEATELFGRGVAVDDIVVESLSACTASVGTSLEVMATGASTATLGWAAASPAPSNGYEWKIVLAGAGSGGTAVVSGSTAAGVLTDNASGLTAGTMYDLFVRSYCGGSDYSSYTGPKTFSLNDDAAGAITLTVGAGCTGAVYTNVNATKSANEVYPSCSGSAISPVWFKFTAPASGAVRISTDRGSGNTFEDSKIGLFSATDVLDYATFNIISCDDDGGSALGFGYMSVLYATGLTNGATYWIAVDKFSAGTENGTFCISVDELDNTMLASSSNTCGTLFDSPEGNNNAYTGWVPLVDDADSKLIAMVRNPTGGAVKDYSIKMNVNAGPVRQDATSKEYYLDRNFHIENSEVSNVQVKLFFASTELEALKSADGAANLSNLRVTRQTGSSCENDFSGVGTAEMAQTDSGSVNGVEWIGFTTTGFSNFYIHATRAPLIVKVFLQGAYDATLGRHRDVNATWQGVLNNAALVQPYDSTAFGNYNGGETVPGGFFTSNAANALDPVDWVLLEVKDASLALVARRAALVREDGKIVDINGDTLVTFNGLGSGDYYITIRHRNHLGISTQNLLPISSKALGVAPPTSGYNFDFSTSSDANIFGTATAFKVMSGTNVMIGGNANSNINVRYGGGSNDPQAILTFLGSVGIVKNNIYSRNDLNMNGTVRYGGGSNDPGFLLTNVLGGAVGTVITEQKR